MSDPSHNAWHRWSNGWRVHNLLGDEAVSTRKLAERTGLQERSIRRICSRLADLRLVERTEDGWIAVADVDVEIVDQDGIDFTRERHKRHQAERILHRRWLAVRIAQRRAEPHCRNVTTVQGRRDRGELPYVTNLTELSN